MYTYEEYSKQRELSSYMTGTITGFIKWNDNLRDGEKKMLAKQLLWCYETAKIPVPPSVQKDIDEILG